MKAEHIQEALNLLPDDLIEKVDRLRTNKAMPAYRSWKQISAIAACLAVLILGTFVWGMVPRGGYNADSTASNGMEKDNAMSATAAAQEAEDRSETIAETNTVSEEAVVEGDQSPAEPSAYSVSAQYILTEQLLPSGEQPGFVLIQSRQALEDYCDRFGAYYDLSAFPEYTDAYFEENDLLILLLQESKPDFTHEITAIEQTQAGVWELQGCRYLPESSTKESDPTHWHILVDVWKDLIDPNASFTLTLTDTEK